MASKTHILIVDDDFDCLSLYVNFFECKGWKITTANNGKKAWEYFQSNSDKYHFILIDHNMPKMTGLEFIGQLRAHGYQTPLVLVSGELDSLDINKIINHYTNALQKPFSFSELERILVLYE